MSDNELEFTNNEQDEVVIVRLPRADYKIMRKMIDAEKTRSSVIKWVFTLLGGFTVIFTAIQHWKAIVSLFKGV